MHTQLALGFTMLPVLAERAAPLPQAAGVFAAWMPSWSSTAPTVPAGEFSEVSFFAVTTTETGIQEDGTPATFATYAKGVPNQLLSLGGWGGSEHFSTLAKDPAAFAKAVTDYITQTNTASGTAFNGVDIDWEFPNGEPTDANDVNWDRGNTCFAYDPNDTANMLAVIKALRTSLKTALGKDPILTAAAPMDGWFDEDGKKLADASAFVADGALDHITLMNYDVASNYRPVTGLNAPLDDTKAPADSKQQYSIKKSIDYWIKAKVPANKLQIGLPAYGKIFRTTSADLVDSNGSKAYQPKQMPLQAAPAEGSNAEGNVQAGSWDKQAVDGCGVWRDYGATYTYAQLFSKADAGREILGDDGGKGEKAIGGYEYFWDDSASSPWLYNRAEKLFITYDNPRSIAAKAKYAASKGLMGVKLFHASGDTGALTKAMKEGWAAGLQSS